MAQPIIGYEKGELYEQLIDNYKVFNYYYEVLMFLAIVGYRENCVKRDDYRGDSKAETQGEAGLHNIHSRDLFHTISACLAFQDTGDPKALVDPDEHKRVIGQYAAGGLEFIEEELDDVSGDPTDEIIEYIKSREGTEDDETIHGELQEIVDAFDNEMMGYD